MSETFTHGYGVVIGVDDNMIKRLALPAVEKDVTAVHAVLIHPERCAYEPDNVRLLKGPDSTRDKILGAFKWLKGKVDADQEATAVIYYSGHGMRDKATELYYLVPYDISALSNVKNDAILAEKIQAAISEIQAKRTLVILDCCHAQGLDVKDIDLAEPELDPVAFPEMPVIKSVPTFEEGGKDVAELAEGEGRAILNSSTGAESSYVRSDQKMSVFTYHLIEALTGHAPHDDEDTVVYVTDVMSWVTRKVKKTAAEMNKEQTPVMRTSGVFPVAQLIGGQGVALSKGVEPPDPLQPLPEVSISATFNQEGQQVDGLQVNAATIEGDITKKEGGVHFEGGTVDINGPVIGGDVGEFVGGNKTVHHEEIHGDKVGGDKIGGDKITVGGISGGVVAIGREAKATGTVFQGGGQPAPDLNQLFVPLFQALAAEAPAEMSKAIDLKKELESGAKAEDVKIAGAVQDIAAVAPGAKPALRMIFADAQIAGLVQNMGAIQFVLGRL